VKEALDPHVTRRELLKLSPLLLLGGFAVRIRERLLDAGVAWSDAGIGRGVSRRLRGKLGRQDIDFFDRGRLRE